MEIRNANKEDSIAIANGESDAASTPGLLNAEPREIPRAAYAEKIGTLSKNPRGLYVVAEDQGRVVGHLLLDPMPLNANSHICTLTIVVYPPRQQQGIGRKLMEYGIRWANQTIGVEKVELMVRASNERAVSLYRSVGFEEEGRIRKRVKTGSTYHDDIAMSLFTMGRDTHPSGNKR